MVSIMESQLADYAVQLDDQGDLVVFVHEVGKAVPKFSSFLVSSKTLSLASRVFSAMLGPHFAEGHRLREARERGLGQRPSIMLREDNIAAMNFILSAIHGRADRLQSPLTAEEIVTIAIHSDKYDLNNQLTSWIDGWCNHRRFPVRSENKVRDMGYGMLAAYLFRSPRLENMSAHYVQTMPPDFAKTWEKHDLMEHLPEDIWNHLSHQITRALHGLRFATLNTLNRLDVKREPGSIRSTGNTAENGGLCKSLAPQNLYLDALKQVGIWPSLSFLEGLPVNKAGRLIHKAKTLAVCGCKYSEFAELYGLDTCPLQTQLASLSQRIRQVQAQMKGFKSRSAIWTPN